MRITRGLLPALLAPAAAIGWASSVWATTAPPAHGGVVHVFEVSSGNGNTAEYVITGAISDYGVDHEGVAGNGNVNRIVLSKGSFEIDTSGLPMRAPSLDPTTCAYGYSATGTVPLSAGTGAYAGIKGSVTARVIGAGILPKLKDGKCDESATANSVAAVFMATGTGTVTLP